MAESKQISHREEREILDLSKFLDNYEEQLDSPTSFKPSSLSHIKNYKTLNDLSTFLTRLEGSFAIHFVTSNNVAAIYRNGDNYTYFDSNTAFISELKSVDQLMKVLSKTVKFKGYKVEEKGSFSC